MDAFDSCDYDLLDVMDPWGCSGIPLDRIDPLDDAEASGSGAE